MKRAIVVLLAVSVLMIPVASWSGESCDMAYKFGGKNIYWNTMCWFDILIGWE